MSERQVNESPFTMGSNEEIAFSVTIPTSWGTANFSDLSVALFEDPFDDNTDVTSTKLSGSASASGQVITTPVVKSLTAGQQYWLSIRFDTSEGNQVSCYAIIEAER